MKTKKFYQFIAIIVVLFCVIFDIVINKEKEVGMMFFFIPFIIEALNKYEDRRAHKKRWARLDRYIEEDDTEEKSYFVLGTAKKNMLISYWNSSSTIVDFCHSLIDYCRSRYKSLIRTDDYLLVKRKLQEAVDSNNSYSKIAKEALAAFENCF